MTAFDLGPKTGAEPTLEPEHDSGLLRECPVECRTTHRAQLHEDLAKPIAVLDLSRKRLIELVTRNFALRREQCSKQRPIAAVVVHMSRPLFCSVPQARSVLPNG